MQLSFTIKDVSRSGIITRMLLSSGEPVAIVRRARLPVASSCISLNMQAVSYDDQTCRLRR